MNNVDLIGRLARDVELRTSPNGNSYVFFTVAVNEYHGGKESATFVPCVAFDKVATNMANFLHKGSLVGVSGRISVRTSEDNNGQRRTNVSVNASRVEFLDNKGGSNNGSSNNNQGSNNNSDYVRDDSNIDMDVINGFEKEEKKPEDNSNDKDNTVKDDDSILWD